MDEKCFSDTVRATFKDYQPVAEANEAEQLYDAAAYVLQRAALPETAREPVFRALMEAIKNYREVGSPEHGLEDMDLRPELSTLCAQLIERIQMWQAVRADVEASLNGKLSQNARTELRNIAAVTQHKETLKELTRRIYRETRH